MSEAPNVFTDLRKLDGNASLPRRALLVGACTYFTLTAARSLLGRDKKDVAAHEAAVPQPEQQPQQDELLAAIDAMPPCTLADFQNGVQIGQYVVRLEHAPVVDEIQVNDKTWKLTGVRGLAKGATLSFKDFRWEPGKDGQPGTLRICVCAKKIMLPVKKYINIPQDRVDELLLDLHETDNVPFSDDDGDDTGADLELLQR